MTRRDFMVGVGAAAVASAWGTEDGKEDVLDLWQRETDLVKPETYKAYLQDGDTRGLASLEKLERGFAKAFAEIKATTVTDKPAIWQIYNMGFVVKTRESLFSIDLNHRRDLELAPTLDFALITHNHDDHYRNEFYRTMDRSGKTVIQNFADNYGAADWKKPGKWWENGGFIRGEKTFRIRDVEIHTGLTDHNPYLVDFTTAFEIRVGKWKIFHSGDCGNEKKLKTIWGRPDVWLAFPGCGIDIANAQKLIQPKKMAFGHLWELAHKHGRLTTPMVKKARAAVLAAGGVVDVPLWGERVVW